MNSVKPLLNQMLPTRVSRVIRRLLLRRHIGQFERRIVGHEYLGFRLKVSLQDNIAAGWYDHDWESMPEVEFLKRGQLQAGAKVFDVGAHQGVIAMVLARLVGESGLVVAVEGTRHNAEVAVENCRINGITNVVVECAIAAEEAGLKLSFSETLNGSVGGELLPVEVPSVSIDSLAIEYGTPQVVFVDVEGYECQVFEGARKTLSAGADFFVEVHVGVGLERHGSVERLLSSFDRTEYALFWSLGEDAPFQELPDFANLPRHKFFLIAMARKKLVASA